MSKVVTPALIVAKFLGLVMSLIDCRFVSISNPLTYALPVETTNDNKDSLAVLPSSVVSPSVYVPWKISPATLVSTDSSTLNSNGRTV